MQTGGRVLRNGSAQHAPPTARRPAPAQLSVPGHVFQSPSSQRCRGQVVVNIASDNPSSSQHHLSLSASSGRKFPGLPSIADDGPATNASVTFRLKFKTSWGQSVRLIGTHPTLGAWSLDKALDLHWAEGDFWVATVALPTGAVYEYKYVVIEHSTKQPVMWQAGGNAVLAIDIGEEQLIVRDTWGNEPGAEVQCDGQAVTRESKLQKWAGTLVSQYKTAVQDSQQLIQWAQEGQAIKGELTRVKMELSMMQQAQRESDIQVAALKDQNSRLQQDLMHARQELNASFAEALKLLTEDDGWEAPDGSASTSSPGGGASASWSNDASMGSYDFTGPSSSRHADSSYNSWLVMNGNGSGHSNGHYQSADNVSSAVGSYRY